MHLGGVEDVQRPAAVIRDVVGDIDQRVDGTKADRREPALQPLGRRAVLHAAHEAQPECGTKRRRRSEVERHRHRAWELALDRLDGRVLEGAHVGRRQIARDAVHAGAVGPVGRELDLDHRVVEARPLGVVRAERRVGRQVDDAVMVIGDLQLELGDQHAAALDAADLADAERHVLAGDIGAGRHEHAGHAGARIGRAAHDLHGVAAAGIDHADAQPVGVGMLLGGNNARDGERRQRLALVLDLLDFQPDHGELVGELVERLVRVEMLLEPGQGEFHGEFFPNAPASPLPRLRGRVREGACSIAVAIVSKTPCRFAITS